MNNKELLDEIEILDDVDTPEPPKVENDWLKEFNNTIIDDAEIIEFDKPNIITPVDTIIEDDFIIEDIMESNVDKKENIDVIDFDVTVPSINDNFDSTIEILDESVVEDNTKEVDNKKSILFIGILFVILIIFVFALPYIKELIK